MCLDIVQIYVVTYQCYLTSDVKYLFCVIMLNSVIQLTLEICLNLINCVRMSLKLYQGMILVSNSHSLSSYWRTKSKSNSFSTKNVKTNKQRRAHSLLPSETPKGAATVQLIGMKSRSYYICLNIIQFLQVDVFQDSIVCQVSYAKTRALTMLKTGIKDFGRCFLFFHL